jgi:hypothetical protein
MILSDGFQQINLSIEELSNQLENNVLNIFGFNAKILVDLIKQFERVSGKKITKESIDEYFSKIPDAPKKLNRILVPTKDKVYNQDKFYYIYYRGEIISCYVVKQNLECTGKIINFKDYTVLEYIELTDNELLSQLVGK